MSRSKPFSRSSRRTSTAQALGGGVDGVKADGDFAFEVAPEGFQRQAQPLAGFLVLGTLVVMTGTFRARPVGLQGVGPPVDEETEVIRHHTGWRFERKHPHSLLCEVSYTAALRYVGGEMMRIWVARIGWLLSRSRWSLRYTAGTPLGHRA